MQQCNIARASTQSVLCVVLQGRKVVLVGSDKRSGAVRAGIDNLLSHAADKSGRVGSRQSEAATGATWLPRPCSLSPPTDSHSAGTTSLTMSPPSSGAGRHIVTRVTRGFVYRQLRRDGHLADVTLMCAGGRQVGGVFRQRQVVMFMRLVD